jgi:hypothetical protein
MDAAQLYSSTLELLNATLLKMLSPAWDVKVQSSPADVRHEALVQLLKVQHARLVLGNAILQEIASSLKENEKELLNGQKALRVALDKLTTMESALNTVKSLVDVVARIVPLL